MHTMARLDRRYDSIDVIRIFENNLSLGQKRVVIAFFFSLIPIKEPKIDAVGLLLDLLSLVPIAGTFGAIFQIGVATAQAARDIAELFDFELEDVEKELAEALFALKTCESAFKALTEEKRACIVNLDQANERINALLATISLLEEELRDATQETGTQINQGELDQARRDVAFAIRGIDNSAPACGLTLLTEFSAMERVATFLGSL